jgi:hypothetical protein
MAAPFPGFAGYDAAPYRGPLCQRQERLPTLGPKSIAARKSRFSGVKIIMIAAITAPGIDIARSRD